MRRAWVGLLLGAIVLLGASPPASPSGDPSPPPTPAPTAWPIDLEASVLPGGTTLAVTKAFADSIEDGIHLVPVRIVEAMDVAVTLKSLDGLTLAEAPTVCLYWHDAAPDDAGLESALLGPPRPIGDADRPGGRRRCLDPGAAACRLGRHHHEACARDLRLPAR